MLFEEECKGPKRDKGPGGSDSGAKTGSDSGVKIPYIVGDFVYLEPCDTSEPYRIGKIVNMDLSRFPAKSYAKLCLFWRVQDIPTCSIDVSSRKLAGTMQKAVARVTKLQGKCTVKHISEIEDLEAYEKLDDCFYFSQLYNPSTRRMFDVIRKQDLNPPGKFADLLEPYDYIVVEENLLPQERAICSSCLAWCFEDYVKCFGCNLYYHLKCTKCAKGKKLRNNTVRVCFSCFKEGHSLPRESQGLQEGAIGSSRLLERAFEVSQLDSRYSWPFLYYGEQANYADISKRFLGMIKETYLPSNRLGAKYAAYLPSNSNEDDLPLTIDFPNKEVVWLESEIRSFEAGVRKFNDDLRLVSKCISTKTTKQVVSFYYKWLAKKRVPAITSLDKHKLSPSYSPYSESGHSSGVRYCPERTMGPIILNINKLYKHGAECKNCCVSSSPEWRLMSVVSSGSVYCKYCSIFCLKYGVFPKISDEVIATNKKKAPLRKFGLFAQTEKKKSAQLVLSQRLFRGRVLLSAATDSDEGIEYSDESADLDETPEQICSVCFSKQTETSPSIIFCVSCKLSVHKTCYGVLNNGEFKCSRCINEESLAYTRYYSCIFCPKSSQITPKHASAVKLTRGYNWAHLPCAIWTKNTAFGSTALEPIYVSPPLDKKICSVCHDRSGICTKCFVPECGSHFHASCARKKNCCLTLNPETLELQTYCLNHSSAEIPTGSIDPELLKIHIEKTRIIPQRLNTPAKRLSFAYDPPPPKDLTEYPANSSLKKQRTYKDQELKEDAIFKQIPGNINMPFNILGLPPKIIANGK